MQRLLLLIGIILYLAPGGVALAQETGTGGDWPNYADLVPDPATQDQLIYQGILPDELYGIPIDPSSRLFLAVVGLLSVGVCSTGVGSVGLLGTFIAIRRNRRKLRDAK